MYYQLASGKVIQISVEEYLRLSDEELNDLHALKIGRTCNDPFSGSAIKDKSKPEHYEFMFDEDADNYEVDERVDINSIPDESDYDWDEFIDEE